MKKRVLIISASPRKMGNSELLCEELKKGAIEAGHQVEKIRLQDKKIHYCQGCYACKEHNLCFQKDDMEELIAKMIAADCIVLATPVYFYSMAGQLKTMIDRTLPRYLDIKNKSFVFIATAADGKNEMETTIDSMRGFTDCLPNAIVKQVIYGENAWQKGEVIGTFAMQEAYECGKQL